MCADGEVVVVVGVRVPPPSWCVQGKISFHNLKRVAKELGENLTDEELQVSPPLVTVHCLSCG